jgi:hypothetical protein
MARGYQRTPGTAGGGGSSTAAPTVGTSTALISDPNTARPSVSGPVHWMMAAGVTPANALAGDTVWDANGLSVLVP